MRAKAPLMPRTTAFDGLPLFLNSHCRYRNTAPSSYTVNMELYRIKPSRDEHTFKGLLLIIHYEL